MHADASLLGSSALLGDDAIAVLTPAVAVAGGALLSARATQLRYHPGQRLAVRYAADVRWADGTRRSETLGAVVQRKPLPADLAVVESTDGARVGVWRYPHDPFLPGLPHAAYDEGARAVLAQLGIDVTKVTVEPVVYRPASRAVLRVTSGRGCVYLKVVRPRVAPRLRAAHEAFGTVVRVPRCLAWSDELGLIVLETLEGEPLTRSLVDGGRLPSPAEVFGLVAAIKDVPLAHAAKPTGAEHHTELLAAALPSQRDRIMTLASHAAAGSGAPHTVHGDYYHAQVLTTAGTISGLLDIDGARAGSAYDDAAMFIAHLVALAHVHPQAAQRIHDYRADAEALLGADLDAGLLHAAVTGALLGLATTSFRRQETDWRQRTLDWLDLVDAWVAHTVPQPSKRALRSLSSPPHRPAGT